MYLNVSTFCVSGYFNRESLIKENGDGLFSLSILVMRAITASPPAYVYNRLVMVGLLR